MRINRKLDNLLFDTEKDKENTYKTLFDTQSIYESLDIQQDTPAKDIDYYMIPYNNNNKEKNLVNFGEKISDMSLKDKILKISMSLKSLNVFVKPTSTKISFDQINSKGIENFLTNKNVFINFLSDFIIDLIWKIKEENLQKESFIEKINSLNSQKEELEKKIKKINFDLVDQKKELHRMNSNVISKKEILDQTKKSKNSEFTEIKTENKKLSNMLQIYKNEIRKREIDYVKIQEKIKKLLHSPLPKNQFFEVGDVNDLRVENDFKLTENNFHHSASKVIYLNSINEFNNQKYDLMVNQNYYLMSILKHLQTSFDNLLKVSGEIRKNISSYNSDENALETLGNLKNVDFYTMKENIFSIHLLESNLLEEFYDKFVNNFNKYEEFVLKIIDLRFTKKNEPFHKKHPTLKSFNNSVIQKTEDYSMGDDKYEKDILKNFKKWGNSNSGKNSTWLNNMDKSREINYIYDESQFIKGESDNEYEINNEGVLAFKL